MKPRFTRPVVVVPVIILALLFLVLWARTGAPATRVLFSPFVGWFGGLAPESSQKSLQEENEALRELVSGLAVDQSAVAQLISERDTLAAAVGYREESGRAAVTARVIARARDPFTRAVFLNKGASDGVTIDAPVVAREGIFIGVVKEVWEQSALVLLANDDQSRVPAYILGKRETLGILEGHGVLYHLTLVPQDATISEQTVVVTSALGTSIPPGLVIGTVAGNIHEEGSPFQTIYVTPPIAIDELTFVSVLKPLHEPELPPLHL